LSSFYTDSEGNKVDNPRHLRKSEKALKRLQRRVSKKFRRGQPQSNNYKKAKERLGRKHLKVTRQRRDFAVKLARCVVMSSDIVAYEDWKVKNLVKNRALAKSISDAAWSQFTEYLQGGVFGRIVVAVPPEYTSQDCSGCGTRVRKSLSTRTHECPKCKTALDRDQNAAINILIKALREIADTVGQTEFQAWGEGTSFDDGQLTVPK
jgi:putative transposase